MNNELNRIIANLAELQGKPLREYRKLMLANLSKYEIAAINQALRLKKDNDNVKQLSWD